MVKTAGVASGKDLFALVEKSGLLAAEPLQQARELLASAEEPRTLAKQLVSRGWVTRWQANQLLNGYHALTVGKCRAPDARPPRRH
jgi:hypothetical protein